MDTVQLYGCIRKCVLHKLTDFNKFLDGALAGGAVMKGDGGHGAVATGMSASSSSQGLKQVERTRSVFPETWLWLNSTTG